MKEQCKAMSSKTFEARRAGHPLRCSRNAKLDGFCRQHHPNWPAEQKAGSDASKVYVDRLIAEAARENRLKKFERAKRAFEEWELSCTTHADRERADRVRLWLVETDPTVTP